MAKDDTELMNEEVKNSMIKQQKEDGFDHMSPAQGETMAEGLPSNMVMNNDQYAKDEYKVGHNKPPMFLVVLYILVLVWCAISWIPFYGY
jgi:hypothetical protein